MSQPQQGCATVTVDMRALIDKVLARYSGEFTVFRELLQNSDDAKCDTAEIHFETAAFLGRSPEGVMNADSPVPPDLTTAKVTQWTFKNHGQPFTPEDWGRLPKIALGNPNSQSIGAFGVGFYSLFSITESPYVSSGDKEMEFSWDAENQLHYRFEDLPESVTRDLWTTFKMPLRKAAPIPPVSRLIRFLASSITFMVHLKDVAVFIDQHLVGQVNKSSGQPRVIPIPTELDPLSPEKNMRVESVQQHSITIKAEVKPPPYDSMQLHETEVNLAVFTAEVDVPIDEELSEELHRCTKKNPPRQVKYSLIYTDKDEYDQSGGNEQNHHPEFPSSFQGLRADLDGSTHTRVFIGHATAQTTGFGGHMASYFIPTVERESIDLVDSSMAIWNKELLYVGGFLCRVVYESELSKIQHSWEEATASEGQSRPPEESQDQFHEHFLHVLKFFTFYHSTPSPKVARLLAKSFYGCSSRPLRLLSSVGVREAPDVRAFDPVFAKFLKSLPMLSKYVTQHGAHSIAELPDQHKISAITLSDVLQDLCCHTLDVGELVACLRWWITPREDDLTSNLADLLRVATLRGTSGAIQLSTITHFIDREVLGRHIPTDGPLPLSLIPLGISKHFSREELASFGWKEFTVTSWLQHISQPDVMSADKKYDFTRTVDWASRVLSTFCRVWPQLSQSTQNDLKKAFLNKPCIPTSEGLHCPERSYLPIADNALFQHLDLPIVGLKSGFIVDDNMKRFLLFIGVRKNLPVQSLLQMLSTGEWTAFNLVDHLVREEPSLTDEDFRILESNHIFMKESFQSNGEENIRYRTNELYPPVDIFRRLQLPVIEWSGKSEWSEASPEARLLYRLGLNHFPPLLKIVELCSSENVGVQGTAFVYLCNELGRKYPDYKPENFLDVEFIPAESNGHTCLKKLGEVYFGTQWKILGFSVVQEQYQSAPLQQLGVMQHPLASTLLDLLKKSPPPDEETASHWFEVLFDHMAIFSPSDLIKLSCLPIVPTGPSSTPSSFPPTKCYLDQGPGPVFYAKLFEFVNFGTKANRFLSACGSKSKVSIEDVAEVLIENPERFFELAGGYEGFLAELRKLAYQSHDISNDTLHRMSDNPALLGVRRKKAEDQSGWDYEHQFLKSQEVIIVDDITDYQLFSDHLFVAPQEEALERFYKSLGCNYLSAVVEEGYNNPPEVPDPETCAEVQSLILQRLPLFTQKYTATEPKVTVPSSSKDLKVTAYDKIRVSKTLVTRNVKQTRDVWMIARCAGDCVELWISKTAKRDMYEVATSLCRLLFGTNKTNATLLLETILSADLDALERRGFLVPKTSQKHGDRCKAGKKAREKRSAGSALTTGTNSLHPSKLHTQPIPTQPDQQLDHEILPDGSETTLQSSFVRYAADSTSCKIGGASDVSGDKSLDTDGRSTVLPSSRTSRGVIPQEYIRNNVENAIKACGLGGEESAGVGQLLSSGFCRVSADVKSLIPIGKVKDIEVCVDGGVPDTGTFMKRMADRLARFTDIIVSLSEIYCISPTMLRVFYDASGGCIAFNCKGIIYLNLCYFEEWHDKQVKNGDTQNARMSWFLTLAHEIAHNLTSLHNSDHEFWFSAICESRLVAFSQLLRPASTQPASTQPASTWPRYMLWMRHVAVVVVAVVAVLFAYLVKRIAPVANIL